MTKFPQTLYVRMDTESDDTPYPAAYESLLDAVDGDGPTAIGRYELKAIGKHRKVVEAVK